MPQRYTIGRYNQYAEQLWVHDRFLAVGTLSI